MGLLHLREFEPLRIYATASVSRVVREENTMFRVLERSSPPVDWETLRLGSPVPVLPDGATQGRLTCTAIPVGGEFPEYAGANRRQELPKEEAVIALELAQNDKRLFYAPTLPACSNEVKCRVAQSDLTLLDGTFWSDTELIEVRGGGKTASEMGHLPLSGARGTLRELRGSACRERVLIHINNTNPILDEDSTAHRDVREAGWQIAHDGMEFEL
jgi:pyrroloquinoline quinone biosynthesis protein B